MHLLLRTAGSLEYSGGKGHAWLFLKTAALPCFVSLIVLPAACLESSAGYD
jgi:hypothetical protein